MMFNIIFAAVCISALLLFNKKTSFLRRGVCLSAVIFILLSVIGGRLLNFYSLIPFWDKILHFISGFILAAVANALFARLGGDNLNKKLKSLFILFFTFASACVWEIYEFCGDILFGFSSQGNSLSDTMIDMIVGSISGLIYLLIFYIPDSKKFR